MVALAQTLKLSVIAEGVETPEQRDVVKALGCDQAQGFFFSRAEEAEEIGLLLGARAPLEKPA